MDNIEKLLEQIDSVKQTLTDQTYRDLLDTLTCLRGQVKIPSDRLFNDYGPRWADVKRHSDGYLSKVTIYSHFDDEYKREWVIRFDLNGKIHGDNCPAISYYNEGVHEVDFYYTRGEHISINGHPIIIGRIPKDRFISWGTCDDRTGLKELRMRIDDNREFMTLYERFVTYYTLKRIDSINPGGADYMSLMNCYLSRFTGQTAECDCYGDESMSIEDMAKEHGFTVDTIVNTNSNGFDKRVNMTLKGDTRTYDLKDATLTVNVDQRSVIHFKQPTTVMLVTEHCIEEKTLEGDHEITTVMIIKDNTFKSIYSDIKSRCVLICDGISGISDRIMMAAHMFLGNAVVDISRNMVMMGPVTPVYGHGIRLETEAVNFFDMIYTHIESVQDIICISPDGKNITWSEVDHDDDIPDVLQEGQGI